MSAAVLSGKELAAAIRTATAAQATELTAAGTPPKLAVVVATAEQASAWYVRSIATAAHKVVAILDYHKVELAGRHVAVIGRSTVVGKPAAHLLLNKNATVTVCHSRAKDLAAVTSTADVVVVAVGRAGLVTADMSGPGPWW